MFLTFKPNLFNNSIKETLNRIQRCKKWRQCIIHRGVYWYLTPLLATVQSPPYTLTETHSSTASNTQMLSQKKSLKMSKG